MRLYNFDASPNPLKVRMSLAELELEYETSNVNLFQKEQARESFLRVNPYGQVPVLQDGALTLRESNAIVAYLGKAYGKGLWPTSTQGEGSALQWLFFESCDLVGPCGRLWWADVVTPVIGRSPMAEEKVKQAIEDLKEPLELLERLLEKQPFILGSDFSLVDCVLGVTLNLLAGTRGDARTIFPNTVEYRTRIRNRPSWAEAKGEAIHNPRMVM